MINFIIISITNYNLRFSIPFKNEIKFHNRSNKKNLKLNAFKACRYIAITFNIISLKDF